MQLTDAGGMHLVDAGASNARRLAEDVRAGRIRAVARAISEVERDSDLGCLVVGALGDAIGGAHRIGITGPPGAGKSSLVGELIGALRRLGRRVGVVAVDPSSRATGGAILGDRVRMEQHAGGPHVFIRSLGSRGEAGGLSLATARVVDVLDAAGYDPVLIETTGAGQAEVEISEVAHTRVVVLPPGLGDEVQAIKAGMMEIADVFVVSKSDAAGAEHARQDLLALLRLRGQSAHGVSIVSTSVIDGSGISELADTLVSRGRARPRLSADGALTRLVVRRALRTTEDALGALPPEVLLDLGARVRRGEMTLAAAASRAVERAFRTLSISKEAR